MKDEPAEPSDPRDAEIADLKKQVERLTREGNLAVAVMAQQRNRALDDAAQARVELELLKAEKT